MPNDHEHAISGEVTQDAREAAVALHLADRGAITVHEKAYHDRILAGARDSTSLVQAFARYGARIRAEVLEEAARVCEKEREDFANPEYAGGPLGAFGERFGCATCATAIRALAAPVEGGGGERCKRS